MPEEYERSILNAKRYSHKVTLNNNGVDKLQHGGASVGDAPAQFLVIRAVGTSSTKARALQITSIADAGDSWFPAIQMKRRN